MNILDVSVVIPCYNANDTLLRSLKSVVRQTAFPREIIVVDDGSDNPIEPLISQWVSDIRIPVRVITQPNRGAPAARNAGLQIAESRYVAFLDSDDIWFPDKLKIQYSVMMTETLTICGHGYVFNAGQLAVSGTELDVTHTYLKRISKWRFAYGNPLFTPTVMVCKNSFSGFDERFRRVDDYKAWVESFRSRQCGYIDLVLAAGFKPPIGHSGLTGSIDQMHESYLQVLRALLDEGRINFSFYSTARLIEGLKLPVRKFLAKSRTIAI